MADTGLNSASSYGAIVNEVGASAANVYSSNNAYVEFQNNEESYSGFGLSAEIDDGATIDGIEVVVEAHNNGSGTDDLNVKLSRDGANWTSSTLTVGITGATDATYTLGGPTNLWGWTSVTKANFTDANFHVWMKAPNWDATCSVDHLQVKVYFTPHTNYSIDATVANFTLTNNDALFHRMWMMAATVANFALSGVNIIINRGVVLTAEVSNYILTGIDAIFSFLGWTPRTKPTTTYTDRTKPTTNYTLRTKPTTIWTKLNK